MSYRAHTFYFRSATRTSCAHANQVANQGPQTDRRRLYIMIIMLGRAVGVSVPTPGPPGSGGGSAPAGSRLAQMTGPPHGASARQPVANSLTANSPFAFRSRPGGHATDPQRASRHLSCVKTPHVRVVERDGAAQRPETLEGVPRRPQSKRTGRMRIGTRAASSCICDLDQRAHGPRIIVKSIQLVCEHAPRHGPLPTRDLTHSVLEKVGASAWGTSCTLGFPLSATPRSGFTA